MSFLSYSADYQGVVDVFMRDPIRYLPFAQLLAEIMNGNSELSIPQREMIALHVSALNECHYCIGSHRAVLGALNIDEATISAAQAGTATNPRMDAVLSFSGKLTQHPGTVVEADVDTLLSAGWSEQTVEDVIGVVSLFSFLNRLADGLGIKGSDGVFAQGGSMIAQDGYEPVVQMLRGKTAP